MIWLSCFCLCGCFACMEDAVRLRFVYVVVGMFVVLGDGKARMVFVLFMQELWDDERMDLGRSVTSVVTVSCLQVLPTFPAFVASRLGMFTSDVIS